MANPWLAGGAGAGAPLPLLVPCRRRRRQRARRHPPARRRRAARHLHRVELPQAGDRRARRARVAARIVDPVSGHARGARGGEGSAPIDRRALSVARRVPCQGASRRPTHWCCAATCSYDDGPRILQRGERQVGRRRWSVDNGQRSDVLTTAESPAPRALIFTSSPTRKPPVSSAAFQLRPKSLRLMVISVSKPTRALPHGSFAAPR